MTASPRRIVFLVFDGMKTLDVVGPAEVFAEAVRQGADYELLYCSPGGGAVRTSIGALFPADSAAADLVDADTVIVSGGDLLVGRPVGADVVEAARHLRGISKRMASVCTGAFVLAEAGMLDGRRATTHWEHAATLAVSYPLVSVEPDAIYVRDGDVFTSAGVSAGIDLALALVESDHGAATARAVARQLVVYMQRAGNQSQFSAPLASALPSAPALRAVVDAINAAPADELTLARLAQLGRVSERHLTRLFRRELATTPAKYVESVRFDLARALLDGGATVTRAAIESGFGSPETLRRVFLSRIGLPPSGYRQRFLTTGTPH